MVSILYGKENFEFNKRILFSIDNYLIRKFLKEFLFFISFAISFIL